MGEYHAEAIFRSCFHEPGKHGDYRACNGATSASGRQREECQSISWWCIATCLYVSWALFLHHVGCCRAAVNHNLRWGWPLPLLYSEKQKINTTFAFFFSPEIIVALTLVRSIDDLGGSGSHIHPHYHHLFLPKQKTSASSIGKIADISKRLIRP